MALWIVLCIGTGFIAFLTALTFPARDESWIDYVTSAAEGLSAGAMLAMISGTMLPEAYEKGGPDLVGFWTVCGFVAVLGIKLLFDEGNNLQD